MPQNDRVKAREIVDTILAACESTIEESHYVDYVRTIYRVYLQRELYDRLGPVVLEGLRKEAIQALTKLIASRDREKRTFLGKQSGNRSEALGDWVVEFHANDDDVSAADRVRVIAAFPQPQHTELPTDDGTIKVPSTPATRTPDDPSKTQRVGNAAAASGMDSSVYARLSYRDDTGSGNFDMTREVVKVGRGGESVWVDLTLHTVRDISREHFQIRRDAATGKFFIKDLSAFGTSVNGKIVPPSIEEVDGKTEDKRIEVELPREATINLAGRLEMKFKATSRK